MEPSGWGEGNNAQPVNDGRCCNVCNWTDVIPTRLGEQGRQGDFTAEAYQSMQEELKRRNDEWRRRNVRFYSNN